MANIWFTSDNHFGHGNILKFCPNTRKCSSIEEHDRMQVEKLQALVKPEDDLFFLGDVFFSSLPRAMDIMDKIPGHKHLIYGNHDQLIARNKQLANKFENIYDYKELNLHGTKVVLFHFPMIEWNKMHHGSYALFGHVHGSLDNDPMVLNGRTMDVGVDSRPNGVAPEHGMLSPWNWTQVNSILSARNVRPHHGKTTTM